MKISINWLKRYLALNLSTQEIQEKLDAIGFEVESVETIGTPLFENVVIGKILSREQHPNADRLGICAVQVAPDQPERQIVCGATNYNVGDHVPVALPGSLLPNGIKIKKSKLRGALSEGMMCSARELGLGDDAKGLLILKNKPPVGQSINTIFPAEQDSIINIAVTPNRPDCLSHLGIARELSAAFDLKIEYPSTFVINPDHSSQQSALLRSVNVATSEECPYYSAYTISNVKVAPSPEWMQQLLRAIGLRPVNNIVDCTNFVLHEYGQPLHAFDASKIEGARLLIRHAKEGETIKALNHQDYSLQQGMTVIADEEKPLVIAGIMGGLNSEIDVNTTTIVLESAYFNPPNIRQTARKLGLSTDSSYRFERGVDPSGAFIAAQRATELILETAGGHIEGTPVIIEEKKIQEKHIQCSPDFISDRLGFSVPTETIKRTLEKLLLKINESMIDAKTAWDVVIPNFRVDLERPIDLVEEFLRHYGTNNIPKGSLTVDGAHRKDDPIALFQKNAAPFFKHHHFNECFNYTTCSHELLKVDEAETKIASLDNPLSADQSQLRYSLIPGLLQTLQFNRNHSNEPQRLFEIGHVFPVKDKNIYELIAVAFLWVQSPQPEAWYETTQPDFYNARDLIDQTLHLAGLSIEKKDWQPVGSEHLWQKNHAAHAGDFTQGVKAYVGLLDLLLLKSFSIEGQLLAGEMLFLPEKLRNTKQQQRYQPFSIYPPVSKHLAIVVDKATPAEQIRLDLEKIAQGVTDERFAVESVKLFDLYQGKGLEEGKKSFAFSIVFRSNEETLTDEVVNKAFNAIQQRVEEQTDYHIRR